MKTFQVWAAAFAFVLACFPTVARADDDGDDDRFAAPPPGRGPVAPAAPVAVDEDYVAPPPIATEPERARSAVRVGLGPVGVTTGKGMGVGVGGSLDIGRGSVGGRLSALWTRGEPGAGSPISESFAQYAGELVLDLHKRGPVHPLLGVGFGIVHGENAQSSGFAGVGLLRAGVEYALGFEETDVRLGLAATGGLVGPADRELDALKGHVTTTGYVAIGL